MINFLLLQGAALNAAEASVVDQVQRKESDLSFEQDLAVLRLWCANKSGDTSRVQSRKFCVTVLPLGAERLWIKVNIKINNERAARVIRPYGSVEVVQGDMTVLQELVARRLGFRRENGWSPRESIHDGQLTN